MDGQQFSMLLTGVLFMLLLNLEHRGGLLGDIMHKWFLKAYQCEKQSCKYFLTAYSGLMQPHQFRNNHHFVHHLL